MPAMNLIDRAIATVAPLHAQRRLLARASLTAFQALEPSVSPLNAPGLSGGGSTPARRTWFPRARDARADTLRDLPFNRAASREQARELWALLSAAMKDSVSTQAHSKAGTLVVKVAGEKEISIQLLDKDGPVSEAWKKVLEYVMGLVS